MSNIHRLELGETLFEKTRRAVLALLFGRSDEQSYLRQIAELRKPDTPVLEGAAREVKTFAR